MIRTLSLGLVLLLAGLLPVARAQVFLADDPLAVDADTLHFPEPAERELSDVFDFVENVFGREGDYDGPALDVNTLGEVPNSSWYTNRHYARRIPLAELARGPQRSAGPVRTAPWVVLSGKQEGKTPGMLMQDATGQRFLLKFDPFENAELGTGAEAVSTPIFHALGFFVPENYIIRFRREDLTTNEDSEISDGLVDTLLTSVYQYPDGTYRALASQYLSGRPIGPFKYYDTRPDDPNDVIPHEARRVLRGLRVFAAWLNHDDSRSINSLDAFVGDSTGGYVRHNLTDFNATLGAGVRGPKGHADQTEFSFHPSRILARALTLNIARGRWMDHESTIYPSTGRYDFEHFDPEDWRQQYPNASFTRMDADDAFWAARQVMHFTDEEIRAFVAGGQYSDPVAADYLARALMARRDRVGERWLGWGGGIDRFRVESGRLVFDDLLAMHQLDGAGTTRTAVWKPFDNRTGAIGAPFASTPAENIAVPNVDAEFLVAEIATPGLGATAVALRRTRGNGRTAAYEVVGVDRCAEGDACGEFRSVPLPAVARR